MRLRIKCWPAYLSKWEFFDADDERFNNKEVDIDERLVKEYKKTFDKLIGLSDRIWKVYNKDLI